VEDSKRPDPVIEHYKGFRIEAYERVPGLWRVRITRVDGAKIKTFPDDDEHCELQPAERVSNCSKGDRVGKANHRSRRDEQGIGLFGAIR